MSKQAQFDELKKKMLKDKSLPLRETATNLVLGEGDLETKILCLGEGPGYWEDLKGRPFVGAAGKFLDQLLHSIKLPREKVFISNVVCYRPPNNRDPLPHEIAAFQPYINKMMEIIKPKVIVTLGRFSMRKFLPNAMISSIHGKIHNVNWKGKEVVILPMYHPAAGLRNAEIKMRIFEDFRKIPEVLSKIKEEESGGKVEQMQLV